MKNKHIIIFIILLCFIKNTQASADATFRGTLKNSSSDATGVLRCAHYLDPDIRVEYRFGFDQSGNFYVSTSNTLCGITQSDNGSISIYKPGFKLYTFSAPPLVYESNIGNIYLENDIIPPVINSITTPPASSSLIVPFTIDATDHPQSPLYVGSFYPIKGFLLSETAALPTSTDSRWSGYPNNTPAGSTYYNMHYHFTSTGAKTIYAWAMDSAGNVSPSKSVNVNVFDNTAPIISTFIIQPISNSLTIAITTLNATDDAEVTAYLITEAATSPQATDAAWNAAAPTGYSFATSGNKILYAWAKDAAGNVSLSKTASVVVDTTWYPW